MSNPLCLYFGECGGCSAQHIDYNLQLDNKKNSVINELKNNEVLVSDVKIFSDKEYFYRNRMDFVFFENGIGLRKKGFFDKIIPIKKCVISNQRINSLLTEIWEFYEENKNQLDTFDLKRSQGTLKYATIRASEVTDSSSITFILNSDSTKMAQHIDLIKIFSQKTTAKNIIIGRVPAKTDESTSFDCFEVKGELILNELICEKKISFFSQSFFQNNTVMAEKMINYCKEILSKHDTKESHLIDLYGGAGTFGVCLGENFQSVLITDIEGNNIDCARKNLEENFMRNSRVFAADASKIKFEENKDLFLITDPPRSGMHPKTIKQILNISPKLIIYVSCNPKQMAKELRHFLVNYKFESLAVFDLFPQTPHVEAIVELSRIN